MARGAGMAGSSSMARPFARYVSFNVLGMVGVSVYILADTFFIANGVGSDGLAALNFSIVLYTVLQATGLMLGIGAATEFQVCSARGDRTGANRVFTTALVMAGCAAAVLLAVVEAFATPLASLLGADEATLPLTVTYLRTIFAFAPLFLLNNVLLPFVRNDSEPAAGHGRHAGGKLREHRARRVVHIRGSGGACSARRSPRGLLRS